jgi:hypothetical protein
MFTCQYCKREFERKSALNNHQKTVRSCLRIQEKNNVKIEKRLFYCDFCKKELCSKARLKTHIVICRTNPENYKNIKILDESLKISDKPNESVKISDQTLIDTVEYLKKEIEKLKQKPIITINKTKETPTNISKKIENQPKPQPQLLDIQDNCDIQEYDFGNNFMVPIRSDGMINATYLCKAGNKRIEDYKENKTYLTEYGIQENELFIHMICGKYTGIWVNRKVGCHLAQWISPNFAVKISTILDQLFITNKTEIDSLENNYKKQISNLTSELDAEKNQYKKLLIKHNSSLKSHRYIKFDKTGPCFYIIDSGLVCDCGCCKFGVGGFGTDTIDDRFRAHRTLWPQLKVKFLVFTKDALFIEKCIKVMYEKEINPNGHEIIEGVQAEDMIDRVKNLIDVLLVKDYYIIPTEKIKEYNDYVDTTIKLNEINEI